jgi:nucleoside-diphosphate-sugar epimerase
MKIFLAGASGVLGAHLLPLLIEAGHQVTALTRSAATAEALRAQGAEPVVGDALDRAAMRRLVVAARPEAVVHQLTAIPPRIDPRRAARVLALTGRLRTEGTEHLMAAALAAGARRFIGQSIAFAYQPGGTGPHREEDPLYLDAPPSFAALNRAAHTLEQITTTTPGIEGVALRYGSFYGRGTIFDRGGSFHEDVLRRRVPLVGGGTGVFSFIHLKDAARATRLAIEGRGSGIYNVVDDEPAPVSAWLPFYASLIGAPPPWRVPRWLGRLGGGAYGVYLMCDQRGAENRAFRAAFAWSPDFPSYREGFRDLLAGAV